MNVMSISNEECRAFGGPTTMVKWSLGRKMQLSIYTAEIKPLFPSCLLPRFTINSSFHLPGQTVTPGDDRPNVLSYRDLEVRGKEDNGPHMA